MQRIVGGVEIQNDHPGFTRQRRHRLLQQECLDPSGIRHDLLVAPIRPVHGEFHAVEGRLARKGLADIALLAPSQSERIGLPARHREQGIVSQRVVIVEVFVTQRQPEDALAQQLLGRVLDQIRVAVVIEASRQLLDQPMPQIDLAQKERAPVAGKKSSLKIGLNSPLAEVLKCETLLFTLCHPVVVGLV